MGRNRKERWLRLDNAAKIFPTSSNKGDTKVFRFSCRLYDPIDSGILQEALNLTLEDFPFFKSILRRGLFWYYFEETQKQAIVKEDYKPPCSRLYFKSKKTLFFEVTYFDRIINLEVHHSLTDGTGALKFLENLVTNYIYIRYRDDFSEETPMSEHEDSIFQREDDSFLRHYSGETLTKESVKLKSKKAYRVKGIKFNGHRIGVIQGRVSSSQLSAEARKNGTTLGIYITSAFIWAIGQNMSAFAKKRPVVVSIPVNLRNYFPSGTSRNFFSTFNVSYNFGTGRGELSDIILCVKAAYDEGLNTERLVARLNALASFEKNIFARVVPLFIKDLAMKYANKTISDEVTCTVSNLGKIEMIDEFKKYIEDFAVCISTKKIQICACAYNDRLVMSFTSPIVNAEIQRDFFGMLTSQGIDVEITANPIFD